MKRKKKVSCPSSAAGILFVWLILSGIFPFPALGAAAPERILLLTAYSSAYEWTRETADGFSAYFMGDGSRHNVAVDVVELGALRNANQKMPPPDHRWIFEKLKDNDYKILVVCDLPAAEAVRRHQAQLPPNLTLVYCGRITPEQVAATNHPNQTGRLCEFGEWENILLGLQQFPETETVLVISATGAEGRKVLEQVAANGRKANLKNVRLQLLSGDDTTTAEMLRQVGELPKKSFVVFSNWRSAVQGEFQSFPGIVRNIVRLSPGPVYTPIDAYLELGLLGGRLTGSREHGREAAVLCERILDGTPAAAIPVTVAPGTLTFNWPPFARFAVPSATARDARFINRPPGWWSRPHDWLPPAGGIVGMLLLALFFLSRDYRKMRRDRAIYQAMPLRIVAVDGSGKIHFHQVKNKPSPPTLDQLECPVTAEFKRVIRDVLADGKERWCEYDCDGRRKAIFTRLDRRVFGVECVMWISMDITDLAKSRDQIHLHSELLRNTVRLADIEYFHFTGAERRNTIAGNKYWPEQDGVPRPAAQWVVPEDLPEFNASWRRLLGAETNSLRISYRAGEAGKIRDFIIYAQLYDIPGAADAPRQFAGMVQDITELRNRTRDYQDASGLLNTILENFPNWVVIKNISDNFRCIMTNCHMANQLNRIPQDIIGKTDEEIFCDDDLEHIRANDLLAVASPVPLCSDESFRDAQGVVHDVVSNRAVISRSDGARLLVTVITDVSALKKVQREAEESNQILRAVLDNVHAGITLKDPDDDFRYMIWNRWLTAKTGMPPESTLGKSDMDLALPAELKKKFREDDLRACANGSDHVVLEKTELDGHVTVNDITRKLLTLPWGKRLLITSVGDLTLERKATAERENTIAQLNHYVEYERIINRCLQEITLQNDFAESIAFLLREIGETTHADRCYIFEIAADDIHVSNTFEWHAPKLAPQQETLQNLDLGDFPGFHARLLRKEDIAIVDMSAPPPEDLTVVVDFWRRHEVRSLVVCGIWENGRLWGYIGIDFVRQLRQLTPSDLHIVHNAANLVLLAREREQRINALADSVSLQAQIFDNISVPILLIDTQFNVVKTNSEMEQHACWDFVPGGGKCYHRFCEGGTRPAENCPVQQVISTGKPCSTERLFGKVRIQINAQPIYDRSGKLIYILESGFDITELRRQQEQLAAYLGQEQVVSECLKILVLNRDFDTALQQILPLLGRHLQVDVCAVFRYDAAADVLQNLQTWEPQCRQKDNKLQPAIRRQDFPACFQALFAGGFQANLHVPPRKPEQFELCDYLKQRKMQAIACVPIHFHDQFWGHVGMEFASPDKTFGDMEIRLLAAAARIIEILLARETLYAKLLNSENEKNMIWELMTVPLVLFDADRNIIRVNPATERLCGKTSAEIIAQPCAMTLCHHEIPEEKCPVVLTRRERKPQHMEITLFGLDFEVSTLPVFENGQLVRILQIFIDITENNANKRKLLHAVEAAEAAARAKSTFLATMSHEIRTPLNAVIGFSELLQGGEIAAEEQLEYLRSINFAGNALLQLINDILDLSKLESEQMQIVCEKADLRQLCEEMMSIFSLRVQEKNLELRLEYPANVPRLYFSVLRLRQVLLNLIGNAVKFTTRGHITLSVAFERQEGDAGTLSIKVCDTGVGIAEEFRRHIFQPFFQHEKGHSHQEGTGLGLVISKRLVEHMGGSLSFESTPGVGTCFTMVLSGIRCDDTPTDALPLPAAAPAAAKRRRRVLLVDDVPLNLKVLQAMLKQLNVQVTTAACGADALAQLSSVKPDLVLTDMWMPEMNGAELAGQIRQIPEWADLTIYAVTADSEAGGFPEELFDGILLKPLSLEKLKKIFLFMDDKNKKTKSKHES